MTIGEALKQERLKRGLSIREMASDIISPSSYSRVERNQRDVGSSTLIKLLFAHDIDLESFFSNIKSNYASEEIILRDKLNAKMKVAFDNRNAKEVNDCLVQIMKLPGEKIFKLRAIVATAYLEDEMAVVGPEIRKEIFKTLDHEANLVNNIEATRLFSNSMPIFSDDQLNELMGIYINKAVKQMGLLEIDQKRIAVTNINYLRACYERKIKPNEVIEKVNNYMENVNNVHLLVYKGISKLSYAAICGDIDRAKKIKAEMIDIGSDWVKKWEF